MAQGIPGLNFAATGNFDFTIDPTFRLPLGLRIGPGLDFQDRFYVRADGPANKEISLAVTAQLNDPNLTATIGFLDVRMTEDSAVTPNDGITITANIGVDLTDPGTAGADNRILFEEFLGPNPLNLFDVSIDGVFDIDGLKVSADIGSSSLGSILISLDGESGPAAPGHITSLSQLQNLPSAIQITGEEGFLDFNNITPEVIIQMISALIDRLQALDNGGVFDTKIPIINKKLGEIVDLAQGLADKFGDTSGVQGALVSSAKKLETWLNSKLTPVTVTVTVANGQILFAFGYSKTFAKTFPLSFDVGRARRFGGDFGDGELECRGQCAGEPRFGDQHRAGIADAGSRVFRRDQPQRNYSQRNGQHWLRLGQRREYDGPERIGGGEFWGERRPGDDSGAKRARADRSGFVGRH